MKNIFIILAILGFTATASANIVIAPSIGYVSDKQKSTTPSSFDTEQTATNIDIKAGYILPMGLYLGAMYSSLSYKTCSGSTCSTSPGYNIGPTVGYFSNTGFYALLTYYIMGEVGDTTKYTGAKGPQVDLGWIFPLSAYFSIGPQLSYKTVSYDKIENSGTSIDTDYTHSYIAPYLTLWFMF